MSQSQQVGLLRGNLQKDPLLYFSCSVTIAVEVRHLFKRELFDGQKGNSSAAQLLFGSLFLSWASILVHVILVKWTSQCKVYPLVNLRHLGHFVGSISSLRSERFGKLASICRLLSKVCWETLPPLLRYCNPDSIYSVSNATALWIGEFLSTDFIYWIHECRLWAYKMELVKLLAVFSWKLCIQLWKYSVWHIVSAFVLVNSGSGALGEQSVEEKSERDFSVRLWSPVWFMWVTALPNLKKGGTRQEILSRFACQIPFSVET